LFTSPPGETDLPNGTVHPAAANDIALKTRAARGSVCNGLLFAIFRLNPPRHPISIPAVSSETGHPAAFVRGMIND